MSGAEFLVGMLSSATYDAIKIGKNVAEPGFTGLIVETVDELSSKYKGVDESLLHDFFLSEEISTQVKIYRKTAEIDYPYIEKKFEEMCKIQNVDSSKDILQKFFKILEKKLYSKQALREKIELHYLQKISDVQVQLEKQGEKIEEQVNKIPKLEEDNKKIIQQNQEQ